MSHKSQRALSTETVNQLFYLLWQNCLTANQFYSENALGKDIYGKEACRGGRAAPR